MTALRWLLLFGLSAITSATEGINQEDLEFLARMKQEAGTVALPSGLMYKELVSGSDSGKTPNLDTVCALHFTVAFSNGTQLFSSYENDKPFAAAPGQLFEGFKESMMLMKAGDTFVFLMPPEIGPGDTMGKISIPPGHVLIFTIELLEVTNYTAKMEGPQMEGPNKEGWEFLAKKKREKDVEILPSGLMYKEIVRGTGEKPDIDIVCLFHFTATFINGTKLRSSYDLGEPLRMAPNDAVKELRAGLLKMPEGSIWEFYLPPELGFSNRLGGAETPPNTVLICTFEFMGKTNQRSVVKGPSPEDIQYLSRKEMEPGVVLMPSGLMFKEIVAGDGKSPNFDSLCSIHYKSTLVNGTKLHSSYDDGKEPLVVSPNEVSLKGMQEAMQLMKEGSTWEVYIPPKLGYGEKGLEGFIHEGAVLIYELELMKVEEVEELVEGVKIDGISLTGVEFLDEKKEEPGVVILPSGLMYKEIVAGTGKSPKIDTPCSIHYIGTLVDGTEFDSSYKRGEPLVISPKGVIPGWTEALQLMKEGAKWKLYVPADLGYGKRGVGGRIPGGAVLDFTVTLLEVLDSEAEL